MMAGINDFLAPTTHYLTPPPLAPTRARGTISATPETWQSKTESGLANLLRMAGLDERNAQQTASHYVGGLAALTPLGNAYDAQTSMRAAGAAAQRGDTLGRLGNSAMFAMAALPGVGALRREAKALREASGWVSAAREPIVTQAGRMGLPLGGLEQMDMAHPGPFGAYANVKPRVPGYGVNAEYQDMVPMAGRNVISPEKLEGSTIIPLYGDRSIAGKTIKSINGINVSVPTYGGPRYPEFNAAMGSGAGWASERSPISLIQNKIRAGLDRGGDVYGVYTTMGPKSADQTTMMVDALLQQARQAKIKAKDVKSFDRSVRTLAPGFPGMFHDDAASFLSGATQGKRKSIVEMMDKSPWLAAGFPDVAATRLALTEPELRLSPAGSSGFSMVKFGPESLDPHQVTLPHPTYPTQIAGSPAGQFQAEVPFDMLYPRFIGERRAAGADPGRDLRAFEMQKPEQNVDAQTVDRLMAYLEASRR
jgi:hypothetical protein